MMDPERRRQIEDVFEDALERPPEDREAWLDVACADDPVLLAEVTAMLAAHEIAERVLEPGPRGAESERRVGPYRILRELGRGGMGVVYLGERDDGHFRRRVALKLLRPGPDDIQLRKRFTAERQILAALDHPNIARLLDGGVTEEGLPYLAMEYVEGAPLTAYCDTHRLTIEERLALFGDVCRAVHHAHQNLVIHRDLKPGNILVTPAGEVKLLDFGIAKLINPMLGPVTSPVTRTEQRAMTPEYASPEQVRGEALTTASDVYSLGVVLYELLSGHRPYRLSDSSPAAVVEAVCERDPERPSTRVTRTEVVPDREGGERAVGPDTISGARRTSAERLQRRLRGDLDAIVMMALRKEPGQRYSSAEQLKGDLERYAAGQPVSAHRGSRRYRLGKLVKRHRAQVAAAGLVAASLLTGAGAAMWQAGIAHRERDRAEAALEAATRSLRETEEVTTFLLELFDANDPTDAAGADVTARELLARGLARLEELDDVPEVQARLYEVVGRVLGNLGDLRAARPHLERSLELRRALHPGGHPDVASSLNSLGVVVRSAGEPARAAAMHREALELQRRFLVPDDPAIAETLIHIAYAEPSDFDQAEALYREALEIRRSAYGPDHPVVAGGMVQVGAMVRRRGRYDEAETLFRQALALRERVQGPDHPETAATMIHLGDIVNLSAARTSEAETLYRRALQIQGDRLGEDHPRLLHGLASLASLLAKAGRLGEAEALYRRIHDIRRRLWGPRSASDASGLEGIAYVLSLQGRYDEAERLQREALEILRETRGASHPVIPGSLANLAEIQLRRGDVDAAEATYREALAIRERLLAPSDAMVAIAMVSLAEPLLRKGELDEAEALLTRAESIFLGKFAADHVHVRATQAAFARLHAARGDAERAEDYRRLAGSVPSHWPRVP